MKKNNSMKGFTLAELLVVVAIIAVLVAVSIPVFTGKLERARETTDIANMRAAKAAAVTAYLGDETITTGTVTKTLGSAQTEDVSVYYNSDSGKLQTTVPSGIHGKGTAADGGTVYTGYSSTGTYTNQYIIVTVVKDGTVNVKWSLEN